MIRQLIYQSVADIELTPLILTDLLETSTRNNVAHGITGILSCIDGEYTQLLEGEEAAVEALMRRIERDRRHHSIRIVHQGNAEHRLFGDWAMAYDDDGELYERMIIRLEDALSKGNASVAMAARNAFSGMDGR